jgi:DNA polymerase-3 subunit gamma/tau
LGTLLNRIAIAQTVPSAVPDDLPERDDIVRLAPMFSPEDVQLYYQIVVHGRHELGLAPDEYSGFTMTLLRMLAFAPIDGGGIAVAAPAPSAARAASAATASSAGAAATAASSAAASAAAARSASAPAITKAPPSTVAASTSAEKPASRAMAALAAARASKILTPAPSVQAANAFETAETPSAVPINSVSAPMPTAAMATSTDANANANVDANVPSRSTANAGATVTATATAGGLDWPVLVKQLSVRGVARQLAMQSELLSHEDNGQAVSIRIRVPLDTLLSAGSKEKLMTALSEHLGKNVHLDTEIGATTVTAHAADVAEEAQRQRQAEQTVQEDPFVQTLMREFGATIVPGSVRPL